LLALWLLLRLQLLLQLLLLLLLLLPLVGTVHHVILQSTHRVTTASMVCPCNQSDTPRGSGGTTLVGRMGEDTDLRRPDVVRVIASMVCVTKADTGSE
jgi:hypothetical protein